ncbi:MAG: alpha-ketoglutarate-dependent dioxygenase AlkB, partial [Acidimicrobiia bacterium]|nr:alpha-ketoglutarate-dependent dioxygenase AlkB [Acidimicrobiia bacterium]
MMTALQLDLLTSGEPDLPDIHAVPDRIELGDRAWIDHCPSWLPGADRWFEQLRLGGDWIADRRTMYDRMVDVPRLVWFSERPEDRVAGVADLRRWFEEHYCRRIRSVSANWYRGGQDSVAMHHDRVPTPGDTIVAIVSLGGRRPLVIRSDNGGPSMRFSLGHGDLLVMGGTFQATHQHGVPKV